MKAIVTGASGLIGSRFVELYGSSFDKLYQLGRSQATINADWIYYDFSSHIPIDLPQVDVIFHFAGQTSSYKARDDVIGDFEVNTLGFWRLLESAKKQENPPFIVLAGTATQVGFTNTKEPISEKHCNNPSTFYDISKMAAEHHLLQCVREGWLQGCCLRLCNVYGGSKSGQCRDRGIIDRVFQMALNSEPISLYGMGDYYRDYIHIDDVASAFFSSWQYRDQVNGQYFNIGSGTGIAVKDAFRLVARLAKEVSGRDVEISVIDPPIGLSKIEFRSFVADISKFIAATGWKPHYTLEEGIRYSYKTDFRRSYQK